MAEKKEFHKQPIIFGQQGTNDSLGEPVPFPTQIGPYAIEGLLAKGGMSLLYLSSHPKTKEPLAIKVLSERFLSNKEIVKRFLREAEIISLANHPNIVKLYDQGEWEGGMFIAMEFIEGVSLREYLLRQPLSLKQALEFIIDIAYALCHLHSHGVIHRDLKPENILVTESLVIKVIDFGIAQLLLDERRGVGKESHVIGSPIYMSPEQRDCPDQVSYPSDIYSLGIIGYELILGKLSQGKIHLSMMPEGLQKIFSKMLRPKSAERYQDIVDVIAEIYLYMHSPNFKNESRPFDQLKELALSVKRAEASLLPSPQQTAAVAVDCIQHKGMILSGIYYDFFSLEEKQFAVLCIEPLDKGVEAILYTAVLRGMVKGYFAQKKSAEELLAKLNQMLCSDTMQQQFQYIYIYAAQNGARIFCSMSGHSPVWLIGRDSVEIMPLLVKNPHLGVQKESSFQALECTWKEGDHLLFASYTAPPADREAHLAAIHHTLSTAVKQNFKETPKNCLEHILRQIRVSRNKALQQNSITLINIVNVDHRESPVI